MDIGQILWGINSLLLALLGFFGKIWISRLSADMIKMDGKIDVKLDILLCNERHGLSLQSCKELFRHKHSPCTPEGRGGEVIIP